MFISLVLKFYDILFFQDNMNEIQKLSEQFLVARQIESSIYLGEYLGALKQKLVRIKADGRLGEMMESCNMNDMQLGYLEREMDVFIAARNTCAHMGDKNLNNFTKEELESCTEWFYISKHQYF